MIDDFSLTVISIGAGLSALVAAYYWCFRAARLDDWRQDLFAVRNRLWDDMEALGALDHPAHRRLRHLINALIHLAPVTNLVFFVRIARKDKVGAGTTLSAEIAAVEDRHVRAALSRSLAEMTDLLFAQLFFNSLPGMLIGWAAVAVLFLVRTARTVTRLPLSWLGRLGISSRRRWESWTAAFTDQAEAVRDDETKTLVNC
jgi:hypothetical protein